MLNTRKISSTYDNYLVIKESLFHTIGCEAAMVLKKVEYWIKVSGREIQCEPGKWIYNSSKGWQEQFPNFSIYKIRKIFNFLESECFIRSKKLNSKKWNQTKWYTIVYDKLETYNCYQKPENSDFSKIKKSNCQKSKNYIQKQ